MSKNNGTEWPPSNKKGQKEEGGDARKLGIRFENYTETLSSQNTSGDHEPLPQETPRPFLSREEDLVRREGVLERLQKGEYGTRTENSVTPEHAGESDPSSHNTEAGESHAENHEETKGGKGSGHKPGHGNAHSTGHGHEGGHGHHASVGPRPAFKLFNPLSWVANGWWLLKKGFSILKHTVFNKEWLGKLFAGVVGTALHLGGHAIEHKPEFDLGNGLSSSGGGGKKKATPHH